MLSKSIFSHQNLFELRLVWVKVSINIRTFAKPVLFTLVFSICWLLLLLLMGLLLVQQQLNHDFVCSGCSCLWHVRVNVIKFTQPAKLQQQQHTKQQFYTILIIFNMTRHIREPYSSDPPHLSLFSIDLSTISHPSFSKIG